MHFWGSIMLVSSVHALYFHMGETETKCFIEEIPNETMVTCEYCTQLYNESIEQFMPASPGIGMHVDVFDPDHNTVLSKFYASEGRFVFTSHTPGEHRICLHSNSTKWSLFAGGKLKVNLKILTGEHANDYKLIAERDKLTDLQLRMRQLLDQSDQISKEQTYQRYREERFRNTSDSTNQRVLYWALVQTLVLFTTASWQMKHLKQFFEAKKLV